MRNRFAGPFRIKKLSKTAYEPELPADWTIHSSLHISRLKAYKTTTAFPSRPKPRPTPPVKDRQADWVYSLEDVLDRRVVREVGVSIVNTAV